jgi:hypothetical protein
MASMDPEMFKKWMADTPNFESLPERVGKKPAKAPKKAAASTGKNPYRQAINRDPGRRKKTR